MKRVALTLLQTSITVFLLWWIFRNPETRRGMAEALKTADFRWLVPAILSVGCACLIQTERWRRLLLVQKIDMGWWRTLRVYFIGMFFNLFLLGATGGDIIKIFYAMKETAQQKSAAFLSVLVDRMMGLLAMVAVAIVLVSFRLGVMRGHPITEAMLGSLVLILGGSVAVVIAGFLVDRFDLARFLPRWLPLHARIIEVASAFSIYAKNPRVLAFTFGISLPAHVLNFLAFYFAARAFGAFTHPGGLMDVLSILPVIMTIAALPISLSGIGVREKLFQNSFGELFGTPESLAALISLTGFMVIVFWGLVGGLVYLFYRPSGGVAISEAEKEVHDAESRVENQT